MEFRENRQKENRENLEIYTGWIIVKQEDIEWLKSLEIKLGDSFDVSIKEELPEFMFEDCEVPKHVFEVLKKEYKEGRLRYELRNQQEWASYKRHKARE